MSNMIAHLAVASEMIKKNKSLEAFYLGCISPDAIGSKIDVTRNDEKIVHI